MLTIVSCGAPATKTVSDVVKDFEKDIGIKVTSRIYFTDLSGNTAGRCYMGLNFIQINLLTYMKSSNIERKALIYHELGHCLCGLGHDTQTKFFCAVDLMYPSMQNEFCYKSNWTNYIKRLKSQCRK